MTMTHLGDATANVRLGADVVVLVAQALEDPLGAVTLLGGCVAVVGADLADHPEERPPLRSRALHAALIAGWLGQLEHLLDRVVAAVVVAQDLPDRHLLDEHLAAYFGPFIQVAVHPSPVPARRLSHERTRFTGTVGCGSFRCALLGPQCGGFRCAFTPLDRHGR